MKISLNWLSDYVSLKNITNESLMENIINRSAEVEAFYPLCEATNLIIGHVVSCEAHPDADKLSVCAVDTGKETLQIICGAPNVAAGQKVIVALPGSVLPGDFKIKKTSIRGVESNGMICSLKELGIEEKYHQEEGIHVLSDDAPLGADAVEHLAFNDNILELDLTPNRPDLMSLHGVAYDIKAIFDTEIEIPTPNLTTSSVSNPLKISTDTDKCMSYYGRVVDNLTIKPSPEWMRARLIASGIRPINNVVDITNYVMLETNQPLHAFDYEKVATDTIVVRTAKEGETFLTLDEQKRTLKEGDILITNGEEPIALGGVMGGYETEVTESTTSLILESATFDPVTIRRTSKRLDLRSESSNRFEKGLDPAKTRYALERACELFQKYADADIRSTVQYFDNNTHSARPIAITLETINGVLGTTLDTDAVKHILNRLSFDYETDQGTFTVYAPTRRVDIETYQDIIEEIGRIYDYNNLETTLPSTISKGGLSDYQRFKRIVRDTLSGLSLEETLNYSLVRETEVFDLARIKDVTPVKLANPISEAHDTLSISPLNGLVENAAYNFNRKQPAVNVFEIGKRYAKNEEPEVLGILMSGPYRDERWQGTPNSDFFTLKGIIEALFKRFNIYDTTYEPFTLGNYHPHQTALIKRGERIIGHIGKLHPEYTRKKLSGEDIYVGEIELEELFHATRFEPHYEKVLKYPSVSRDIALVVNDDTPAGDIIKSIHEYSTSVLSEAYVFDVYQGDKLEEGNKSLAVRLRFEDKSGTLKTQTVDEIIKNILEGLKSDYNATLR